MIGLSANFSTMTSLNDRGSVRLQYGALPYRLSEAGALEFLLITSRTTHRWIIPKGWPAKEMSATMAAQREAYEEAGVRGTITGKALGSYMYEKYLDKKGIGVLCKVKVFPMLVKRQFRTWPEQAEREVRWAGVDDAQLLLEETGLRDLVRGFAAKYSVRPAE